MSFAEIRHQTGALRRVQRALRARRTPHAYIFHGPEGVGKGMAARALAGVLLCGAARESEGEAGERMFDACGACRDCHLLHAGTHPDFHLIHRELNKYHSDSEVRKRKAIDLSVDVIREFLIEPAGGRPVCGRAKVFCIDEAERMSQSAQNALLKTLEEPPPATYLILLTRAADRLFATTQSRCQCVPFAPLPVEFVRVRLLAERPEMAEDEARYLAIASGGQLGTALADHADGVFAARQEIVAATADLAPGRVLEWARTVQDAAKELGERMSKRQKDASDSEINHRSLARLLQAVAYVFDDVLRLAAGEETGLANADQLEAVRRLAGRLDGASAARAVQRVVAAESHVDRNVNAALAIEALGAELCACLGSTGRRVA